jgi:hypothetical protein
VVVPLLVAAPVLPEPPLVPVLPLLLAVWAPVLEAEAAVPVPVVPAGVPVPVPVVSAGGGLELQAARPRELRQMRSAVRMTTSESRRAIYHLGRRTREDLGSNRRALA